MLTAFLVCFFTERLHICNVQNNFYILVYVRLRQEDYAPQRSTWPKVWTHDLWIMTEHVMPLRCFQPHSYEWHDFSPYLATTCSMSSNSGAANAGSRWMNVSRQIIAIAMVSSSYSSNTAWHSLQRFTISGTSPPPAPPPRPPITFTDFFPPRVLDWEVPDVLLRRRSERRTRRLKRMMLYYAPLHNATDTMYSTVCVVYQQSIMYSVHITWDTL